MVVRHGGRKKTAGDGVSVGAVAPAAAAAALQAKQAKQEADFYRFQRREARRSGAWGVGGWSVGGWRFLRRGRHGANFDPRVLTSHHPSPFPLPTELAELRAKFEEDKKRVAALRESRRFRPS